MAGAELLLHRKRHYENGGVLEMKLWRVHRSVRGSGHLLKYSLFYGEAGHRLIGYDNEAGKGDHRHYGDREEAYEFSTVPQLMADFLADVRRVRGGKL
jgi:hypothetical protein